MIDVLILCGGRGSRLGTRYTGQQKCCIENSGTSPLLLATQSLARIGMGRFFFLTGHNSDHAEDYITRKLRPKFECHILHSDVSTSTAEAVMAVKDQLPARFAYHHGNICFSQDDYDLMGELIWEEDQPSFLSFPNAVSLTHPVLELDNGRITGAHRYAPSPSLRFKTSCGFGYLRKDDLMTGDIPYARDFTVEQLVDFTNNKYLSTPSSGEFHHFETTEDFNRLNEVSPYV